MDQQELDLNYIGQAKTSGESINSLEFLICIIEEHKDYLHNSPHKEHFAEERAKRVVELSSRIDSLKKEIVSNAINGAIRKLKIFKEEDPDAKDKSKYAEVSSYEFAPLLVDQNSRISEIMLRLKRVSEMKDGDTHRSIMLARIAIECIALSMIGSEQAMELLTQ